MLDVRDSARCATDTGHWTLDGVFEFCTHRGALGRLKCSALLSCLCAERGMAVSDVDSQAGGSAPVKRQALKAVIRAFLERSLIDLSSR